MKKHLKCFDRLTNFLWLFYIRVAPQYPSWQKIISHLFLVLKCKFFVDSKQGCILLTYLSVIFSKFIQKFAQKCQYFTLIDQSVPLYNFYITFYLRTNHHWMKLKISAVLATFKLYCSQWVRMHLLQKPLLLIWYKLAKIFFWSKVLNCTCSNLIL